MEPNMESELQAPVDLKRREMLRQTGVAVFVGLTGGSFIPIASAAEESRSDFIEKSLAAATTTPAKSKMLVAYASMYGSTSGIALAIGEELARQGHAVDVRQVAHVSDVRAYQGVVIGSAIKSSEWLADAVNFLKTNREYLEKIPVAYFHASMTMATPDNEKTKIRSDGWFAPLLKDFPGIVPRAKSSFAGALEFKKMSLIHRVFYPLVAGNSREGDYRNFVRIRDWALETEKAMCA